MSGSSGQLYPGLEQAMLRLLQQAMQCASSQSSACLSSQASRVYPGLEPWGSSWAQHVQQEGSQSSLSQPAAAFTTRESVSEEHCNGEEHGAATGMYQVQTEMQGAVKLLAFSLSHASVDLCQDYAGTALQLRLLQGSLHTLLPAASTCMCTILAKSCSSPLTSPALGLIGDNPHSVRLDYLSNAGLLLGTEASVMTQGSGQQQCDCSHSSW